MSVVYISPSEEEERVINTEYVRELYRVGKVIGYTYIDGETSTASMDSIEDAKEAFEQIFKIWENN